MKTSYRDLFVVMSIFFSYHMVTAQECEFSVDSPGAQTNAWFKLRNTIEDSIAGQPVDKNILSNLVTFSEDNKFELGEMVVVKRLAGGYTYGFIMAPQWEAMNPNLPLINFGGGLQKKQFKKVIGKIMIEPNPNINKFIPIRIMEKKSSRI